MYKPDPIDIWCIWNDCGWCQHPAEQVREDGNGACNSTKHCPYKDKNQALRGNSKENDLL